MFNVFQTKIDEILFFSLDKIIIKANTHNPYKNISERMVLCYDRKTHRLTIENSFNWCSFLDFGTLFVIFENEFKF